MRVKLSSLSLLFLLVVFVQIVSAKGSAESLALKAASENNTEALPAIEELRSLGPAGMANLMKHYNTQIAQHIADPTISVSPEWIRITTALDTVSQQRNSYLSGLYWYTDIEQAREVAAQTGKPILSLRLLGKLTDELSCANSRFFRTILYPNAAVSATLRDHFVLHWQSVRPVPLITIDFGDGRKLERTITGNSIHYILDSDGQVIEALPGVYGPQAFSRMLAEAEALYTNLKGKKEAEKRDLLVEYLSSRANKISLAWLADNTKIGGKKPEGVSIQVDEKGEALSIMPLAVTKMMTETTILRAMTAGSEALGRITDEAAWQKIAALHSSDAMLDERSISLIKKQNPTLSEKAFASLLEKFQRSVALDTVRNEYRMHTRLLSWLTRESWRGDVDQFNEKVYAELFLTPRSDPWLGLLMLDTYTAIDNSGVVKSEK
ncbi:MAG TPA: hypothetical protein VGQ39_11520 [Pyrinomonadaceae bacterium]|jgi:hypothetical protein|nr:hypothetical protein [Pyrinomonadaceae bacterium]